jgi:hypothetical protein
VNKYLRIIILEDKITIHNAFFEHAKKRIDIDSISFEQIKSDVAV